MAEISIRDVAKTYGKTTIMEGVSLDIRNGEFVVILGPAACSISDAFADNGPTKGGAS